jgi:hypothetical protein
MRPCLPRNEDPVSPGGGVEQEWAWCCMGFTLYGTLVVRVRIGGYGIGGVCGNPLCAL